MSSIRFCPQETKVPLFSISIFGSQEGSGILKIYDLHQTQSQSTPLKSGSLWTHEWSPACNTLSMGITKGALLLDIETNKFTKIFTNESDVFSQSFNFAVIYNI